jgi:hypothetical protein
MERHTSFLSAKENKNYFCGFIELYSGRGEFASVGSYVH